MDLTESIAPRSDQVNADDLIGGPRTFTIRETVEGAAEQPIDLLLVETDRAYRPSKTMRRVIVAAWGTDGDQYAGRRLTLYREPSIKFGGQEVGGIRISHMSHIDKRVETKVQVSRGKREKFTVEPLADVPAEPTLDELAAQIVAALKDATTEAEVREWGNRAHGRNLLDVAVAGQTVRDLVQARLGEVTDPDSTPDADQ